MNFKRSPFAIQDKNARDLDNAKDYPTIADLMREQKVSQDYANTVHPVSYTHLTLPTKLTV